MTLTDRFTSISRDRSEAIAIVQGDERVTYHRLGKLSASIARYLTDAGLEQGERVAILMTNSARYVAVYYGIWRAAGVTVALNTQSTARDVINWLAHSGARWLFIDENHPERPALMSLEPEGVHLIPVTRKVTPSTATHHDLWSDIVTADNQFQDIRHNQTDLATIIYTSGTTGQPKGVMLSHENLESNVDAILEYLQLSKDDSILNVLPFHYSYGNSVLHTHISVGAKLVLENSLLYPHRVIQTMQREAVTGFSGVPSTFALILDRICFSDYEFSALRYMTQAGGAMTPTLIDKLRSQLPTIDFYTMYGQTEASARLTYLPPEDLDEKRGSIGKAIQGVTIEIRDKANKPAATGETGEICAQGPNIMQGYWRDAERTQQVMKDGWLHTGDLAHFDEEGYLYIDGRSSDMIKSGGNRISPQEIEEVILELNGVYEVAAIGVPNEVLGEVVKVFVVPASKSRLDKQTVLRHCKQRLAVYKIPKFVEFVNELPKTTSGKIRRFLLQ
jgi:acyl-CoA synthetase (AMP-forming)/AMP-acid ligase II